MTHHQELQVDCNLYNMWDLAKIYIFTLDFKFLYKQTPNDDRLGRNM
jgi:hypothetical protein